MMLGNGLLLSQRRQLEDIPKLNLIADWKLAEVAGNRSNSMAENVSGRTLDSYTGQGLDYDGATATSMSTSEDYCYETLGFHGSKTASIGCLLVVQSDDAGLACGGHYYYGLPLGIQRVSGTSRWLLRGWHTNSSTEFYYYVAATVSAGNPTRIWWRVDTTQATELGTSAGIAARVRCWENGVEKDVTRATELPQNATLANSGTSWRNRMSFGCGSTTVDRVGNPTYALDATIFRGFVSVLALTADEGEALLTGCQTMQPSRCTTANTRSYWLDDGEAGSTPDAIGSANALTHHHDGAFPLEEAWSNGDRFGGVIPQAAWRCGTYCTGKPGVAAKTHATTYPYVQEIAAVVLPTQNFTLHAWVRLENTPTSSTVYLLNMREGGGYNYEGISILGNNANAIYWYVDHGPGNVSFSVDGAIHANGWLHLVFQEEQTASKRRAYYGLQGDTTLTLIREDTGASNPGLSAGTDQRLKLLAFGGNVAEDCLVGRVSLYDHAAGAVQTLADMTRWHSVTRGNYA